MNKGEFQDKVVVVTGGGMGLGKAYCLGFAEQGATVVCPDINEEAAKQTVSEIEARGGKGVAMGTDVTNADQVQKMVREIIAAHHRVDVLINNVGVIVRVPLLDTTEDMWDRLIDTNLKSAFLVTKAVAPHMMERRQGKIVNLSSIVGLRGMTSTPYSAAKSGITGMTRIWALELAPYRINVNCLAPGFIRTPGSQAVHGSPLGKKINEMVPLGTGDTDCVVPVVLFLSSSASRYITGQCIVVDGGFTSSHDVGVEFRGLDRKKPS
jgi:3-oxoacyl-[acyl-carrier protein] reductase